MRKTILFFTLCISVSLRSQTFIGRTQEEIKSMNAKAGNKLTDTSTDSLFTDIFYTDKKHPISYMYSFNKKNICIGYRISTEDAASKDSLQKVMEKISDEKLAPTAWIQKIDGKNYGWHLQSYGNHSSFSTTQIKKRSLRNLLIKASITSWEFYIRSLSVARCFYSFPVIHPNTAK